MEILQENGNWKLYIENTEEHQRIPNIQRESLTKDDLLSCPFLDYIFQNQEVKFILLSGSTLLGIDDNDSDYELIIYTKNMYKPQTEYRLLFKDCVVHWYYNTLEDLEIDKPYTKFIARFWLFQTTFIKKDKHLMYLNEKYKDEFERFMANRNLLKQIFYADSKMVMYGAIERFLECNSEEELYEKQTKVYHKILDVYYDLSGKERDKSFLRLVKRMRKNHLSQENLNRLKQELTACKDLLLKLPNKTDLPSMLEQWGNLWKTIGNQE